MYKELLFFIFVIDNFQINNVTAMNRLYAMKSPDLVYPDVVLFTDTTGDEPLPLVLG